MLRRLLPLLAFCLLAALAALGVGEIMRRAETNLILTRLPRAKTLGREGGLLEKKIREADAKARDLLAKEGRGPAFGAAVGRLGRIYQANQLYDQALSSYRLALEYDPDQALWHYLTAAIHQQRGEAASMIGLIEQTLALEPGYAPAVLRLADTYFKTARADKARPLYQKRLEMVPGDPYALLGLARISMERGDWAQAESFLGRAIKADSGFGDAHRLMAQVHERQGRTREMEASLASASACVRFHPAPDPWIDQLTDLCHDPEQLLVLGSMALSVQDFDGAIKNYFARALEIEPRNPAIHLALGKAWLMAGDWQKAQGYLTETLRMDPSSDQAYFQLGLILEQQNKLPQAEAMMRRALDYQPHNANVRNNLGVVLLRQGRYGEAIDSFTKALELYPEHVNARYNLGVCLWASGDSRGAAAQYRKVLSMKPEWRMVSNSLAWLLATARDPGLRDGQEALRWAGRSLRGPDRENPEFLDTLAAAQAETGDFSAAAATAEQALARATQAGDQELVREISARLNLYRAGRPFRDR